MISIKVMNFQRDKGTYGWSLVKLILEYEVQQGRTN
jgi:hypothetical protein